MIKLDLQSLIDLFKDTPAHVYADMRTYTVSRGEPLTRLVYDNKEQETYSTWRELGGGVLLPHNYGNIRVDQLYTVGKCGDLYVSVLKPQLYSAGIIGVRLIALRQHPNSQIEDSNLDNYSTKAGVTFDLIVK